MSVVSFEPFANIKLSEPEECPYFGGGSTSVPKTRQKPASKLDAELAALSVSRQVADAERKDCDVVLPKPNELALPCVFFEPRSKRWRRQLLDAVIGWWLS